jgi:hypothetical protein
VADSVSGRKHRGEDPQRRLPRDQDGLAQAVAAINPGRAEAIARSISHAHECALALASLAQAVAAIALAAPP